MNNGDLIQLGFKALPHFTIGNNVVFDLGRGRHLSAGNVGTPNEMLFICQSEGVEITDLICIHNYDYDGYLTIEKVENIIKIFNK